MKYIRCGKCPVSQLCPSYTRRKAENWETVMYDFESLPETEKSECMLVPPPEWQRSEKWTCTSGDADIAVIQAISNTRLEKKPSMTKSSMRTAACDSSKLRQCLNSKIILFQRFGSEDR